MTKMSEHAHIHVMQISLKKAYIYIHTEHTDRMQWIGYIYNPRIYYPPAAAAAAVDYRQDTVTYRIGLASFDRDKMQVEQFNQHHKN